MQRNLTHVYTQHVSMFSQRICRYAFTLTFAHTHKNLNIYTQIRTLSNLKMSGNDRKYDFVVFGATGFTGSHVVAEALRYQQNNDKSKWAIAGRSLEKLKSTLEKIVIEEKLDNPSIGFIEADTNNKSSIEAMVSQARLIFNVVGPYRHFGEVVVEACVNCGTDYIDVCGEPEFLEKMELKYNDAAKDKGLAIIQSCGFDSVPADLGTLFLQRQYTPPACLTQVETFLSVKTGPEGSRINYATYEAAVCGFGAQNDLKAIRKEAMQKKQNAKRCKKKIAVKQGPFKDDRMEGLTCYAFPGADASVIRRTQDRLSLNDNEKISFHVACYVTTPKSVMNTTKMIWYGGIFNTLAKYNAGRNLLLRYPETFTNGYFSRTGPTKSQINESSFELTCYGKGYAEPPSDLCENENTSLENKFITLRVSGPELGYIATSKIMFQMGLLVLERKSGIPAGVMTPGYAASGVLDEVIKRLCENQIKFEILNQEKI